MHQLAPDNKIDLNIVLKCHGYLCFLCAFYVLFVCLLCAFMCSVWAFRCNCIAICHYIFVCALYEHFSRCE